jgi:hypothetical protein
MRVVQRTAQTESDHEVVDLTVYEDTGLQPGEQWGTVLAFAIAGALVIAAILVLWAAAPSTGL